MTYAILFIGSVLFLGQMFSFLFEKTRLPDVLPLMVLGMIIGPGLHVVTPDMFGSAGEIFTTLALIVVLFKSGIDFKVSSLRGAVGQGLLLTTVCFVLAGLVVSFAAHWTLGLPLMAAFIIGSIVADNSAAIIVPMIAKLKIADNTKTILFLEANLTGVYSIVVALALLGVLVKGEAVSAGLVGVQIVKSFGIGIVFALAAGLFWMGVLNRIRRMENAVSLTFAFVLLVYGASELLGGDGAIATLTFGIVAGNIRMFSRMWLRKFEFKGFALNAEERVFFDEVEFIFKTLFFVYMGICMRVGEWQFVAAGALLAVIKLLVRWPVVDFCISKKISRTDASVLLAMCPNGLVSAVLAAMVAQQLPGDGSAVQDVIYSVIFFSVLFSNFISFRIEKGGMKWLADGAFARHDPAPQEAAPSTPQTEPQPQGELPPPEGQEQQNPS